jgi:hypothetical protein
LRIHLAACAPQQLNVRAHDQPDHCPSPPRRRKVLLLQAIERR